ncbi:hypothetical protein H4R24_002531 [Coemansia sp. RSA 988]|nr:hypothetical protein H4R24_002531 [Coemansia sp. RSA 988]
MHSDDLPYGRRGALPIPAGISLGDHTQTPSSGEQYMLRVRLEAESIPKFVVAPGREQLLNDARMALATSSVQSEVTNSEQLPDYLRPSISWLDAFTPYFKHEQTGFRLLLDRSRVPLTFSIPNSDRVREWKNFCYGIDDDVPTTKAIVHALASADQMMAIRLIKWMTTWIEVDKLRRIEGIWLWYLILRLDSLLDHDDTHALRELCRRLISIRCNIGHNIGQSAEAQLAHRRDEIAAINILIAAVTRGYKQYDLEAY